MQPQRRTIAVPANIHDQLVTVESRIAFVEADIALYQHEAWSRFQWRIRKAREAHVEAIARQAQNMEEVMFERGFLFSLDALLSVFGAVPTDPSVGPMLVDNLKKERERLLAVRRDLHRTMESMQDAQVDRQPLPLVVPEQP